MRGHPERPERLGAVVDGAHDAAVADALASRSRSCPPTRAELELVHPAAYLDRLDDIGAAGGGWLDADTYMSAASADSQHASLRAPGCQPSPASARRAAPTPRSAPCALRGTTPAGPRRWGSASCRTSPSSPLRSPTPASGSLIVDYDAHHGNGTQDVFYDDPRVLFVSLHQWPLYPGTGAADETGEAEGAGYTLNLPLPPEPPVTSTCGPSTR